MRVCPGLFFYCCLVTKLHVILHQSLIVSHTVACLISTLEFMFKRTICVTWVAQNAHAIVNANFDTIIILASYYFTRIVKLSIQSPVQKGSTLKNEFVVVFAGSQFI